MAPLSIPHLLLKVKMGWLDNWKAADQVDLHLPPGMWDLSLTVITYPKEQSCERYKLYAKILADEVFKRSRYKWKVSEVEPDFDVASQSTSTVYFRLAREIEESVGKEGYIIAQERALSGSAVISICGATDRAILFGIGRLLREMTSDYHVSYSKELQRVCYISSEHPLIMSAPEYRMRQHQIAYRPKTNSYDAFTPEMMRQEVIDLALFGTNAIEVIPPGKFVKYLLKFPCA